MHIKSFIMASAFFATGSALAQSATELMTPETLWRMGRIGSVSLSPDGSRLLYSVTHYSKEENKGTSRLHAIPAQLAQSASQAANSTLGSGATYIGDGSRVAFMRGNKLCVASAANVEAGDDNAVVVATEVVDFLFSPDAKQVILVRMVPMTHSIAAKDADLPKATGMVINDLIYKHWDHYVTEVPHPFVASFDGQKLGVETDLLAGEPYECPMEPFGGSEQLAWSPDGKTIAYTCRKKVGRDYAISTDSDIYLYDVAAKRTVRNLCKPEGYVEPLSDPTRSLEDQAAKDKPFGGYDQNPQFSPDGKFVAWTSMARDGYESDRTRLCVCNLQTGEKFFVTEKFESGVDEFLWAPDSYTLLFTGVWHGKVGVRCTNLEGNVRDITTDQADYSLCALSPNGQTLYVKKHSMERPDDIYCIALEKPLNKLAAAPAAINAKQYVLTNVNADIYKTLAVGEVKERWVRTVDGKKMLCWVVYPPHFDASKKYPALLFCEGGPQSPVSQFWSYRWNFQMMAANGYVIIAPNRRGLPGFGMEWLEEISGDYTGLCMQDYLSAIDDLATEPYIDKDRLGAVGASFGGFSVYWLAGNHDGRFKAFIAHDGIYNTQQQYVETEEMWFPNWDLKSAPWLQAADGQMQKAFRESPHLYIDKWDTPILCIHGQRDFRIEYTQAESAFNAARLRGLDAQLLLFPDENHWVLKPQNGILWQRTFFRFLDKYLK